jgi:UDP-3-O-[3-hydroxymyristoyl] glucosamine N-acyltransferase
MVLSQVLAYLKDKEISYRILNFVDVEISRISTPLESTLDSIVFFNKGLPPDFNFEYGACVIKITEKSAQFDSKNVICVDNPRLAIIFIGQFFKPYFSQKKSSISHRAIIHPQAKIGKNVIIMDNAILGNCTVGDYTIIYPNVVIYDKTEIGSFCEINANTTIGAEGMGSERYKEGEIIKFPHFSNVVIKDDVFIGPNVTVSRGVLTPTVVETGCRVNAFAHIAHNAHIGKNVDIGMAAVICGSVRIGDGCSLGPNCTIRDGVTIRDNVRVGMGAVVTKSFCESGVILVGVPARIFSKDRK